MIFSRKHFISATAIGASTAALADLASPALAQERMALHFSVLKPDQFDRAKMLATLTSGGPNKQVFQSVAPIIIAPGVSSIYLHMQNSMNAYEFSLGLGKLSTLAVFIGPSIVFGLNDAMWTKYGFGKGLGADLGLAATNIYYTASSKMATNVAPDDPSGLYQDWSAQAIMQRGGQFFVCHNAMTAIAFVIAGKMGADPKAVLSDFEKNVAPGFQVVPAGVAAMQEAQENGWKPFSII